MRKQSKGNRRRMRQGGMGGGFMVVRGVPRRGQRDLPRAPTLRSEATFRLVCVRRAAGGGVRDAVIALAAPRSTIARWRQRYRPDDLTSLEPRAPPPQAGAPGHVDRRPGTGGVGVAAAVSPDGQRHAALCAQSPWRRPQRHADWPDPAEPTATAATRAVGGPGAARAPAASLRHTGSERSAPPDGARSPDPPRHDATSPPAGD